MTTEAPDTALPTPASGFDGRPELREEVATNLSAARHYAALAIRFAELSDDPGLIYSMRTFLAYVRTAGENFADLVEAGRLKAEKKRGQAEAA